MADPEFYFEWLSKTMKPRTVRGRDLDTAYMRTVDTLGRRTVVTEMAWAARGVRRDCVRDQAVDRDSTVIKQ